MNEEGERKERRRCAEFICRHASGFKVCAGCGSIVAMKTALCPACSAYRFDEGAEAVRDAAVVLARMGRQSVLVEDLGT